MKSVFSIFHDGFRKTAVSISRKISSAILDVTHWNPENYEKLETILLSADFGVNVTTKIVEKIRDNYEKGYIKSYEDIKDIAKQEILNILNQQTKEFNFKRDALTVILLVGVNGCGKTTTAGKIGYWLKKDNKKILLAACDTFRAAAVDQLKLWGKKIDSQVIAAIHGADPSSVAFDAVTAALSRKYDYLIIDTAGRQHNKKGLMDELVKMTRTIAKVYSGAPHEIWLVIDGSMGSNALTQAREFTKNIPVNGFICTKLDGTSKGGMVVAIKDELKLPIYFVGLGERPEDLQLFDPKMFVDAVFEG